MIWMNLLNNTKGPHPADVWLLSQQMLRIHHQYRATAHLHQHLPIAAVLPQNNYKTKLHPIP